MLSPAGPPCKVRFGPYELDATSGELRKHGVALKLHPQPFRVLQLLVGRNGEVVTREEIQRALWGEDTFVDFDRGINFCVNQIRAALLDDADHPRYIETLPRRGYRFIAPVDALEEQPAPAGALQEKNGHPSYRTPAEVPADLQRPRRDAESGRNSGPGTAGEPRAAEIARRKLGVFVLSMAAMVLVAAVAYDIWWYRLPPSRKPAQAVERQVTFQSTENPILNSAISPDGKYLAIYDSVGLRVRILATGEEHRLAPPYRGIVETLAWFPDGNSLIVGLFDNGAMWKFPILGGSPTKLRDGAYSPAISRDGSRIVFAVSEGVWVMKSDGEDAHLLFSEPEYRFGGFAWSPDGRFLACARGNKTDGRVIEVRQLDGGRLVVSLVFSKDASSHVLAWLNDWRLVYSRGVDWRDQSVWAIGMDSVIGQTGAPAVQLAQLEQHYPGDLSATLDGKILSVTRKQVQKDVYVGDLSAGGMTLSGIRRLTLDDRDDTPDAWTPDSKAIVFDSDLTGTWNIYKQELKSQAPTRLLGTPETEAFNLELTPDKAWYLYGSMSKHAPGASWGPFKILRVSSSGGSPELVQVIQPLLRLDRAGTDYFFHCSRLSCVLSELQDNHLVFYALDPVQGKGSEIARSESVDTRRFFGWAISPGGDSLAVALKGVVQVIDLHSRKSRDIPLPNTWVSQSLAWAADGKALFATILSPTGFLLVRVDLAGGTKVLRDGGRASWMNGIVPSPDGKHLAFGAQTWDSNVWLIENF